MKKSQTNKTKKSDITPKLQKHMVSLIRERISSKQNHPISKLRVGSGSNSGIRILAYGDSYTAGWHDNGQQMTPYAPILQKKLQDLINDKTVIVKHRGLSGWTAKDMVNIADHENIGINSILKNAVQNDLENDVVTVCIIIVGTNDLGQIQSSSELEIYNNIMKLHAIAHENGVFTISVDIPPNVYVNNDNKYRSNYQNVNDRLRNSVKEDEMRVHIPFPFPYSISEQMLWDADGLHMTNNGYKQLGEALAFPVKNVLDKLED